MLCRLFLRHSKFKSNTPELFVFYVTLAYLLMFLSSQIQVQVVQTYTDTFHSLIFSLCLQNIKYLPKSGFTFFSHHIPIEKYFLLIPPHSFHLCFASFCPIFLSSAPSYFTPLCYVCTNFNIPTAYMLPMLPSSPHKMLQKTLKIGK